MFGISLETSDFKRIKPRVPPSYTAQKAKDAENRNEEKSAMMTLNVVEIVRRKWRRFKDKLKEKGESRRPRREKRGKSVINK